MFILKKLWFVKPVHSFTKKKLYHVKQWYSQFPDSKSECCTTNNIWTLQSLQQLEWITKKPVTMKSLQYPVRTTVKTFRRRTKVIFTTDNPFENSTTTVWFTYFCFYRLPTRYAWNEVCCPSCLLFVPMSNSSQNLLSLYLSIPFVSVQILEIDEWKVVDVFQKLWLRLRHLVRRSKAPSL